MCDTCDLILIRHEEATGNLAAVRSKFFGDPSGFTEELRRQSSDDWTLTPHGRKGATARGCWLRRQILPGEFRLAVSPSPRAKETAYLIIPDGAWVEEPLVRGRLWGGIECLPWNEWLDYCKGHGLDRLPTGFHEAYPNGEAMVRVWKRVCRFLAGLRGKTIIVTHGEVIQMFLMILEGLTEAHYPTLGQNGGHIRNGQVVWYSRRDPATGECSDEFRFKRISFRDTDTLWFKIPASP